MVDDPSAAPPRDLVHSLVPPLGVTRGPSDDMMTVAREPQRAGRRSSSEPRLGALDRDE